MGIMTTYLDKLWDAASDMSEWYRELGEHREQWDPEDRIEFETAEKEHVAMQTMARRMERDGFDREAAAWFYLFNMLNPHDHGIDFDASNRGDACDGCGREWNNDVLIHDDNCMVLKLQDAQDRWNTTNGFPH